MNDIAAGIRALKVLFDKTDSDHQIAYGELEDAIGVKPLDKRWIWNTIDAAIEAGVPVERPRRHSPKSEGYRFTERPFDEWEVGFLYDAAACSRSLSRKEKLSLCNRILKLAPEHARRDLRKAIVTEGQSSVYKGDLFEKISAISKAISEQRMIDFIYYEYDGNGELKPRESSTRVPVEPYVFLFKRGDYYLLSGKRAEEGVSIRLYRLDRMAEINLLDEYCEESLMSLGVDPRSYLEESFGMFASDGAESITLAFDGRLAKYVVERFPDAEIRGISGGESQADVKAMLSGPFFGWIFQFGGRMKIVGPDSVKARYEDLLRKTLEG